MENSKTVIFKSGHGHLLEVVICGSNYRAVTEKIFNFLDNWLVVQCRRWWLRRGGCTWKLG